MDELLFRMLKDLPIGRVTRYGIIGSFLICSALAARYIHE